MVEQNNFQNHCLPHQCPQQEYHPPQYHPPQYQQPVQGIPVSVPIQSISDSESTKNCYIIYCRIAGIIGVVLSIIIIISVIFAFATTDCDDSKNSDSSICNDDEEYTVAG